MSRHQFARRTLDAEELRQGRRMGCDFQQPIQTRLRGTNEQEYEIYAENARQLGWQVKTFDEWMAS